MSSFFFQISEYLNNSPLAYHSRVPKVSSNEQPLPDNLEGLLPTEDTFVHPKPASDGKVNSESQYNNFLKGTLCKINDC